MNDPVFPAHAEAAALTPLYLNLVVADTETADALREHDEGRARSEFAATALKVGVLALRAARGSIDAAAVRGETERLMALLGERLESHRELVDTVVGRTLATYFDPRSGQFSDRVARLVAEDGELAGVIHRKVAEASRGIDDVLAAHLGERSPLRALLAPGEGNQLVASIRATVDGTIKAQSDAVLAQFSLDNEQGALRRLVGELTARHGDLQQALAERVEAVVEEFSLDNQDGALARLVGHVQKAQSQIASEFSLDNQASGLSRLARLVNEHNATQREEAQVFQQQVLTILERIDVRRAEQARSTTHGRVFEDAVGAILRRLAEPGGDRVETVSDTTGALARNKKGDFVITLSDDCAAPGARIVVEAKEDASYKLGATLDEADEARANRNAALCVFVHSRKTAPATLEPFSRHGDTLVVVWDADDERSDVVLRAALACAKALSVRNARRAGAEEASLQRIDEAIAAITKQVDGFDEIRTFATIAGTAAEKIVNRARIMGEQILRHAETLVMQMSALKAGQ